MKVFAKDGLTLLPELMENATLRSNVLPRPVIGRDEIGRMLTAFETFYHGLVDIERTSTTGRELIVSLAFLPSGLRTTITIEGLRDPDGWIQSVIMTHAPDSAVRELIGEITELV